MSIYVSLHDRRSHCLWISAVDQQQGEAGLKTADLIGRPAWEYVEPEYRELVRAEFAAVLFDGGTRTFRVTGGPAKRPYVVTLFGVDFGPVAVVNVAAHHHDSVLETLSPRERQVFDGIVAGTPTKRLAKELGIAIETLHNYRSKLRSKIGPIETWPRLAGYRRIK